MSGNQYNEALAPISWLFGKWRGENGKGIYPTLKDFSYGEEVEVSPVGMKPMAEYRMASWNLSNNAPMHVESGFIRFNPQSKQVAFIVAHNFGSVDIQEGKVDGNHLTVTSQAFSRSSFNKEPAVKQARRTLKLTGEDLEQVMEMETVNTPLTEHLRITYKKI